MSLLTPTLLCFYDPIIPWSVVVIWTTKNGPSTICSWVQRYPAWHLFCTSEVWLVPAHIEGTSLVMELWKVPIRAPKIITHSAEAWTEKRVQALMWTWGDRTIPPTYKSRQDLKDPTRNHSKKQERPKGALKLMNSRLRKGVKDQAWNSYNPLNLHYFSRRIECLAPQ